MGSWASSDIFYGVPIGKLDIEGEEKDSFEIESDCKLIFCGNEHEASWKYAVAIPESIQSGDWWNFQLVDLLEKMNISTDSCVLIIWRAKLTSALSLLNNKYLTDKVLSSSANWFLATRYF
jgi:hypothetical protein